MPTFALIYKRPDDQWWVAGDGHGWDTPEKAEEASALLPPSLEHKVVEEGGAEHQAARVHDDSDDPNT